MAAIAATLGLWAAGPLHAQTTDASRQTCSDAYRICRSRGGPEIYCEPRRAQCLKDGTFSTPFGTYRNLQRR
jgi:hypothetical protein